MRNRHVEADAIKSSTMYIYHELKQGVVRISRLVAKTLRDANEVCVVLVDNNLERWDGVGRLGSRIYFS